ncbi:hypothetical protein LCGC14_2085610 [marine sediment metagenome]|uniref:Uncharacterized protein n=2 Tax=root TaxID=1 RepID=A0A831VQE2_9FLAO|nr:hypothetical protein [Pricia antarctica]
MKKLRPIGTIFTQEFPPDTSSTRTRSRVTTYRVTAHREVSFTPDSVDGMAEEIVPIKIEYSDGEIIEDE